MKQIQAGVKVSIFGKEFMVACPDEERTQLMAAAKYLDGKMREIHDSGKALGAERCAIMAALNIAHELQQAGDRKRLPAGVGKKIRILQSKIDAALKDSAQPRQ